MYFIKNKTKAQEGGNFSPKITWFFLPGLVPEHRAPDPLLFIPLPLFAFGATQEIQFTKYPASSNILAKALLHVYRKT